MTKLLLHVCCAPCAVYPTDFLLTRDYDLTLFFYNPNIHPFREFQKRKESVEMFAESHNLPVHIDGQYRLTEFIRVIVFREKSRCSVCQQIRIKETALFARNNGFDAFSTSLLYSRYQNHEEIRQQCMDISKSLGIQFVYHDFRQGWKRGIESSIAQGLYRQSYCGCIYSEQERYDKCLRKKGKDNGKDDRSGYQQ
ncbi:MAG: epoxyqueuosine reductase QueH [Desulfoprunum sp.]